MNSKNLKINHPCFNFSVCKKLARMHLPVAPDCNIQCNFCNRLYDCVNESRPGVTSQVLNSIQAYEKFIEAKNMFNNLAIIGFAGPGDPLANFEKVQETARLIRKTDKNVEFCLSSNGLTILDYAEDLVKAGFSYITITINALDAETGSKIYEYVNYKGKLYTGKEAAGILIDKQLAGLEFLSSKGIICKINTLYLKGINDFQIKEIAKISSQKGAYIMNLKNLVPAKGSKFEKMDIVSEEAINLKRKECSVYLKQMYHCKQCRSDSVGLLEKDRFKELYE